MKSVVIVVPELLPVPPVQGGAVEHWVDEASRRLMGPELRLAIVSRPAHVTGQSGIEYIGIPWTAVEQFFHRLKQRVTWKNPLRYLAKIQNVCSYGRRVARTVTAFDVVYLHNEPNILLFLRKQSGQKIVLHMHNDHLSMALFRPLYRRALAKVDSVICVSDYIRRQAVSHFPEYANKFSVVMNATDPDVFKPYGDEAQQQLQGVVNIEPDKRYLLYVGRLTSIKGVHVLIEAFQNIHQRLPDTRLIITGSSFFGGAAKTSYERTLTQLAAPVSHAILFTGYLPHDKLKYLYSAVDMVVLPSVWQDPCPLVVFETMASGTCLVSSAVGGIPEVVNNGQDGVLIEANNPALLAQVVCKVLDSDAIEQIQTNARNRIIAGYSWHRLVSELKNKLELQT